VFGVFAEQVEIGGGAKVKDIRDVEDGVLSDQFS
jgi:hypothetical protein